MLSVQISLIGVVILVIIALLFDFINGFHDAANSIATVVSTRVLKPQQAVIFASICNIIAYFVFHLNVAAVIGYGTILPSIVDQYVIFSALIGAIIWSIVTWIFGIPSSSSHALIGGLVGAAITKAGIDSLNLKNLFITISFIFISPLLGFILGSTFMIMVSWLCFSMSPAKVDRWFRRLQLFSAGLYSIGHGGNDAQKTIGIIWMSLIASGYITNSPPIWVIFICYFVIGFGTLFGGWRIVRTMGQKITKLKPVGGFCAEAGGAITLFIASFFGIPVSSTHTIAGAIVGVGSTHKVSAICWRTASKIIWAWLLTIPFSAIMSSCIWLIEKQIF